MKITLQDSIMDTVQSVIPAVLPVLETVVTQIGLYHKARRPRS